MLLMANFFKLNKYSLMVEKKLEKPENNFFYRRLKTILNIFSGKNKT